MNRLTYRNYGTTTPPEPDPRSLTVGQVHLGLGAFHRAHQAVYTEDAIRATGETCWGIAAFTQRSGAAADRLAPQDGLYTVVERGAGAASPRIVGALREVGNAAADPTAVIERICDPEVHVVTLTVTEKGYRHDPVTGKLRLDDPYVLADLGSRTPRTVPGVLAHAIARRAAAGTGPLTVISCDNLPGNGRQLEGLVREFADAAGLSAVDGAVAAFPSTVVDRIVPVTTEYDIAELCERTGVRDESPVNCEPFRQWVIENRFAGPVPAWSAVGAQLVDDTAPWEQLKLRMLNAAHSTLAYLGLRLGFRSIAAAVKDPMLADVCRRLFAEDVQPSLLTPPGVDVVAYGESVLARFSNIALPHTTIQVAADGSQKIGPRLLSTVSARAAQGATASWAALGIAGWALHVIDPVDAAGHPIALADPRADELRDIVAGAAVPVAVRRLVTDPSIVGDGLSGDAEFTDRVVGFADNLHRHGFNALHAEVRQ
ncbi:MULTISPECIES: mannitol dehydrogenase family protein [unclassified Mycobacterium]|uniref:mannitol dehydrogenase family protein n=1 Tax=unclassified Mycobacterium TaxID=2642494 RepID=UPI0029C902B0|nr:MULTISPECIES: mannitol dehydrogenase family protein [unclassified Mycobacterium]